MAEGHSDDWGTGTCDMETAVERWVCPVHRRANKLLFLQKFSEYLQWQRSQIPLRGMPPVLGEMGTSCRQLKSQLRRQSQLL